MKVFNDDCAWTTEELEVRCKNEKCKSILRPEPEDFRWRGGLDFTVTCPVCGKTQWLKVWQIKKVRIQKGIEEVKIEKEAE